MRVGIPILYLLNSNQYLLWGEHFLFLPLKKKPTLPATTDPKEQQVVCHSWGEGTIAAFRHITWTVLPVEIHFKGVLFLPQASLRVHIFPLGNERELSFLLLKALLRIL